MSQTFLSKNNTGLAAITAHILKHSFKLLACAAIAALPLLIPASVKADPPGGTTGWTKTFEDTFSNASNYPNSHGFDPTKWSNTFWWGLGDTYDDTKVTYYSTNNFFVSNNLMTLRANNSGEGARPYTGGVASTYKKFFQTYGFFEAQIKIPKGNGIVPYFLLSAEDTSWPPEVNVFECPGLKGNGATRLWFFNHYKDANGNPTVDGAQSNWDSPVSVDQDFHTYAVLWQPGLLVWYVDGVERYRSTVGVPNKNLYLILANGVASDMDSLQWGGDPTNTTFPKDMLVSWVRVWKRSDGKVGTISIKANANSNYVAAENGGSSSLIADSPSSGNSQTTFDVYDAGGNGNVALVSQANRKIVTAENAGASPLIANRTAIGPWETFQLTDQNGGGVSLTAVNSLFVTAESAGANPLIANRKAVGSWEQFYLIGK